MHTPVLITFDCTYHFVGPWLLGPFMIVGTRTSFSLSSGIVLVPSPDELLSTPETISFIRDDYREKDEKLEDNGR